MESCAADIARRSRSFAMHRLPSGWDVSEEDQDVPKRSEARFYRPRRSDSMDSSPQRHVLGGSMKLPIDTSGMTFMAAAPARPVTDFETKQPRVDGNGELL